MNMTPHQKASKLCSLFLLPILFYSCERGTDGEPPLAQFTYTSVAAMPVTVQFVNTSVSTGGPATFVWDFGDGTTATTIDAVHTYTQPGVYMVKLVQHPSAGASDTVAIALNLSLPAGPSGTSNRLFSPHTASFNFAITARPYTFTFTNTSSGADTYLWKFGDGVTTTTDSITVVHTYQNSGAYQVNLSATNSNGTDTSGATITF